MWATTENQGGNFLGRISIRRNQIASAEGDVEDLEAFQRKISDRFSNLLDADSANPLMSIAWLRKLLDGFLCCEAEFKATLLMGRPPSHILKPPLDRLLPDLLDRTVKSLDICNALTHGVDAVRFLQKHAEIALSALEDRPLTDGQVRRAKKALTSALASIAIDEKESISGKWTERSWSIGRRTATKDRHISNFRSLSWSVSKNWSAAKQIQAILTNLASPRGAESTGLGMTVYIMSVVLAFVTWTLVAAVPCQERAGLGTHVPIPKQVGWAQGMCGVQERVAEEWKKKEKKGGAGLMDEVVRVERVSHALLECLSNFGFPMEDQMEAEVAGHVAELSEACRRMEEGLAPLQRQLREVFHRIVRSRVEVLDMIDQAAKGSAPNV